MSASRPKHKNLFRVHYRVAIQDDDHVNVGWVDVAADSRKQAGLMAERFLFSYGKWDYVKIDRYTHKGDVIV